MVSAADIDTAASDAAGGQRAAGGGGGSPRDGDAVSTPHSARSGVSGSPFVLPRVMSAAQRPRALFSAGGGGSGRRRSFSSSGAAAPADDDADIEEVSTLPTVAARAMHAFDERSSAETPLSSSPASLSVGTPGTGAAVAGAGHALAALAAPAAAAAAAAAATAAGSASSARPASVRTGPANGAAHPSPAGGLPGSRTGALPVGGSATGTESGGYGLPLQLRGLDPADKAALMSLFPEYRLYFREKDAFCMAARKRKKNKTTNYLMTLDEKDLTRSSELYVSKLRANFVGTEFTVYDHGADFKKRHGATDELRREFVAIVYVVVPAILATGSAAVTVQPREECETLTARYRSGELTDLVVLQNKSPQWNEESQSYVLNFRGRVSMPSVKNFQLVHPDHPDYVVLQFGKSGKDVFAMDYQYPLNVVQAFAICLSSFDNKLSVE